MQIYTLQRSGKNAFPNRNFGFDPSHVALASGGVCRFSGIASGNGMVNLLTGHGPDTIGTAPTQKMLFFPGITGANISSGISFTSGINLASDPTFLMAAIVIMTSATAVTPFMFGVSGTNGVGLRLSVTPTFGLIIGGTNIVPSTPVLQLNVPYFVVVGRCGTGANKAFNYFTRLDTGQSLSATFTAATAEVTPTAVTIEGVNSSQFNILGACAYIGNIGTSIPLAMLAQWSSDPWSFWFPHTMFDSLEWLRPAPNSFGSIVFQQNMSIAVSASVSATVTIKSS